jgi:membrane fusion protein (multidrug efflux system)
MSKSTTKAAPLSAIFVSLMVLVLPACNERKEAAHEEEHKVVVTSPVAKDVVLKQNYVCQIHSSRHIEICALEDGYLEAIPVKEGQFVKQGETMFTILPTLYQARLEAEVAERELAQIELNNTERLFQQNVVSQPEVALAQAKLAKAQAKVELSRAELNFATIKAPFDGIIDHQYQQQGSLIAEGDMLTTLSDNSTMWVYFNVPEARYLEYQASNEKGDLKVELKLANGAMFPHVGKIGAIEAVFNNETGNIAFRADFPNPDGLLRHGQTGTIVLSRVVKDAIVIPQRATFEILAKKYVYVVDEKAEDAEHAEEAPIAAEAPQDREHDADNEEHGEEKAEENHKHSGEHGVAHQREIEILSELDDIYLIKKGLDVHDKIILEGIRQVRDGDKLDYEFMAPEDALSKLKYHAE